MKELGCLIGGSSFANGLCKQVGIVILLIPFLLEVNSVSARVLLFLVIPGHLIFFYLICLVEGQAVTSSKVFVLLYLVAAMIQVRRTVAETHSLHGFLASVSGPCPVGGTE